MAAKLEDLLSGIADLDTALKLLIIDRSRNDADAYVSVLRNAGIAVHPTRVGSESELVQALENERPDLALQAINDGNLPLTKVLELVRSSPNPLSVLVIAREQSHELLTTAREHGIRDIIQKDSPDHLQLVVAREIYDLRIRKALASVKTRLIETENRCTALMQSSRDAIAYVHQGMHISANPVYLEMFGLVDMDDLEGLSVLDLVDRADHANLKKVLKSLDEEADTAQVEASCIGTNSSFAAKLEFSPASIDGEPCIQIVIRDQSQDKALEKKIQTLSSLDVLTGLANRNHLVDQVDADLASGEKGALLYLVVDNFQDIRSSVGLAASDGILKELAGLIREQLDVNDLPARFGDHSFTLWLPLHDDRAAEELATRLCRAVEDHISESSKQFISPTCSVGISLEEGNGCSTQELINHAYQACEAVRKSGGNCWKLYDPAEHAVERTDDATADETDMDELVAHALDHDRFRLVYQPIVSLQGDSRENYSVMVRLLDKNDEEILPEHFLSQASGSSQMAAIDRWVIQHAIKELSLQRKQGNKINMFITLSRAALSDESLLLWIIDSLRLENAKGSWLTFQIADEDLRARIQDAKKLIEGVKKIKCQLAIDQFGVMPKFESLLKHLDVDYVKFDGSFLKSLTTDKAKQQELEALNRQVHDYEIRTIATCVEDANSLAVLWTIGIDYTQGYFLQEPSPTISFDLSAS